MAQSGSESLRSTLAGESDSYRPTLDEGSDSFRSTLSDGSDSFRSSLSDGSDSFSSILVGRSDSLKSALNRGHDFIFENCCDLCEREGLQKDAVGFCVDCQDYLCEGCFRSHLRPKPCRNHVLLDHHQMPNTRSQHAMDIHVRSKDDSITPTIAGCVVLPGDKLVVVDFNNINVKLIDLARNKIVSQLKLTGELWDITHVGSTTVAVTSYSTRTIYVVNVTADKLKLHHSLNVQGQCRGVASINDKLVVSYIDPVKVEIINMSGHVLRTVVPEANGIHLFTLPWHVAISSDQKVIYIADVERGTLTSVDVSGNVHATYKDAKLRRPRGITADRAGRVYVCGGLSNNIVQLTADLTELQELIQQSDGVHEPMSVCYNETTERLYIGMKMSDAVKVYQLE